MQKTPSKNAFLREEGGGVADGRRTRDGDKKMTSRRCNERHPKTCLPQGRGRGTATRWMRMHLYNNPTAMGCATP